MGRQTALDRIAALRLIAVIRASEPADLIPITEALLEGGVRVMEYSLTTPGALEELSHACDRFGDDLLLGAGTVLGSGSAQQAIASGAQFIVSPHFDLTIVRICHSGETDIPAIPGALSPTEIQAAWESGADLVKVFPANLGGPRYIRDVRTPLPHLRLLPTGGVNADNLVDFLNAGATAVAVGGSLVDKDLVSARNWRALSERGRQFARLAMTSSGGDVSM